MNESKMEVDKGTVDDGRPRRPRFKYQVFVSSTYVDLHRERERVVWSILEARHIPAGMENFTATDERGWKTITRVIDDTDYYVLILGGLYGSVDPSTNISWTQREYEYATSLKIPVLAFLREQSSIPGDMVERDSEKLKKLQDFIGKVKTTHLCRTWKTAEELSAIVASSLRNHIQDDEDDSRVRPGWIRGDSIPSLTSLNEFARLSAENARLKSELAFAQNSQKQRATLCLIHSADDGSDSPVKRLVTRAPVFKPAPAVGQKAALGVLSMDPRRAELQAYLKKVNSSMLLELSVKNTGQVAARNVVVDFKFPNSKDIHLHLKPDSDSGAELIKDVRDSSRHCHVTSKSKQATRQRLKLIAPGVAEPLVRFYVEFGNVISGGEDKLVGHYSIVDEEGSNAQGQIEIVKQWDSTEKFKSS